MRLIEVTHLTKRYGTHEAVSDLNFRLEPGRVYMVRSAFDRICREAGYDPRAFLSWARQAGRIDVRPGKGFTLTRRINHAPCHCVALRLPGEEDDGAGEAV